MMKLVSPKKILLGMQQEDNNNKFDVLALGTSNAAAGKQINELLEKLKTCSDVHFYSDGAWNMHQLLIAVLEITGPSKLHIASYAMSETAVRAILAMQEAGYIKQLSCAIDDRVETRSAGSFQLLRSIAEKVALVKCHAKVTIIDGELCSLAVIGSANYTENRRIEVGMITRESKVISFHKTWINALLNDHS